jgi:hypothetical protein
MFAVAVAAFYLAVGNALPPAQRARTAIWTNNYGEAAAVDLLEGIWYYHAMEHGNDASRMRFSYITEALEYRAKATGAQIIAWKGFPVPSSGTPYERLSGTFEFVPIDDFPETRLRLPCLWEAYLRSLNAKRRYALRKKLENRRKAAQKHFEADERACF